MSGSAKGRSSNFELLRILCVLGVVLLHYHYHGSGGAASAVADLPGRLYLIWLMELICIPAVDIFVMISGYFLCRSRERSWWKPLGLVVQVVAMNLVPALVRMLRQGAFSRNALLGALIPANYYVMLYSALYIVSPYLNGLLERDRAGARRVMLLLMALFSVYPTLADVLEAVIGGPIMGLSTISMDGSGRGYTIVNFVLAYLVGAWLRLFPPRLGRGKLLGLWAGCVAALFLWTLADARLGQAGATAWMYCNPLVLASAALLLELFRGLELGCRPWINELAGGVFTVFLTHQLLFPYLRVEEFARRSWGVWLLHAAASCVGAFAAGYVIHRIYEAAAGPVRRALQKRLGKLPIRY